MSSADEPPTTARRAFPAALAVTCGVALLIQFVVYIRWPATTAAAALFTFFKYFTILTNLLVLLTLVAHARQTRGFLTRPGPATAVAVYTVVVGVIFTLLLRGLLHPGGLQWTLDIVLHDVIPIGYLLFWWRCVPHGRLRWRDVWLWLLYPVTYVFYNALCSRLSGHNPYPFLDVATLGFPRLLINVLLLAAAFLVLSLLFVGWDKILARRSATPAVPLSCSHR